MNALPALIIAVVMAASRPSTGAASTNLLPGLTYNKGAEHLKGRLIFLHGYNAKTKATKGATIYEIVLSQSRLQKVTDCPDGLLYSSAEGGLFCVVTTSAASSGATVFMYRRAQGKDRSVHLDNVPKRTVLIDDHAFFELERGHDSRGGSGRIIGTEIFDYSLDEDKFRTISLPGAGHWQYEEYERIHAPRDRINALHFNYSTVGERLSEGRDYQAGFYSLDLGTRDIHWFATLVDDTDDPAFHQKSFDGRFIFLAEPQPTTSEVRLLASRMDAIRARVFDPGGAKAEVLHTFRDSAGAINRLNGISPCGHYALVRLQEALLLSRSFRNKYYLVDLSNGHARILLVDEVAQKSSGSLSSIQWVADP